MQKHTIFFKVGKQNTNTLDLMFLKFRIFYQWKFSGKWQGLIAAIISQFLIQGSMPRTLSKFDHLACGVFELEVRN